MGRLNTFIGQKFGLFEVIEVVQKHVGGYEYLCLCDCGKYFECRSTKIKKKYSCGCTLNAEQAKKAALQELKKNRVKKSSSFVRLSKERIMNNGYVLVLRPEHPKASRTGFILEHRAVMEDALGRMLSPEEEIHHKNGIKHDNRLDNLEIWLRGRQPRGARLSDLIVFAEKLLKDYAPQKLKSRK